MTARPSIPFVLRLVDGGVVTVRESFAAVAYHSDDDKDGASLMAIRSLDEFARDTRNLFILSRSFEMHPDLAEVAHDVVVLKRLAKAAGDRELSKEEKELVHRFRRETVNPWVRAQAGRILVLIGNDDDQVAVHDGVPEAPAPVGGGMPELTEEQELEVVRRFALKEEWPDDGVSEDFMDYVRWGVTIGMRYMVSRLPALKTGEVDPIAQAAQAATEGGEV